ncbi:MAG: hypothetical protein ABSE16_14605 [Verrucomicrobiota bacterium]|jgi:hypothetical protein
MKRTKRRLPIPQWEFGFAPEAFNLIVETGIDGERIVREHEQVKKARQLAEKAQAPLLEIA